MTAGLLAIGRWLREPGRMTPQTPHKPSPDRFWPGSCVCGEPMGHVARVSAADALKETAR